MDWLTEPLRDASGVQALVAVVVMGITCGAIGAYVIVRRLAFIGDAVSHAVLPGIVIGTLIGASILLGALVAGLITAIGIAIVARGGRIREDAAIGVLFSGAFALGVVLIGTGGEHELEDLLVGELQNVSATDVTLMALASFLALALLAVLHKELLLTSFDRTLAASQGYPVLALDALLLVLLAVTIVISIQAVGIILVVAMLVTPSATARLLVDRFVPMIFVGAAIGAAVSVAGFYLSFHLGTASGGTIVLVATAVFLLAFVASPTHGVLAHRRQRHARHDVVAPAVDRRTGHEHPAE
ncbi:MAG TPA: metal ABC transporter permease [Candidatus Limnocylindria bacterium]|nr:metal ABC transporter permease [Candidatus Limnocylindria bacterium]